MVWAWATWVIQAPEANAIPSEVTKSDPPLKLRVFVSDIRAIFDWKNMEVAVMAKKSMKQLIRRS